MLLGKVAKDLGVGNGLGGPLGRKQAQELSLSQLELQLAFNGLELAPVS